MNKKCGVCRGEGLSGPSPLKKKFGEGQVLPLFNKKDAIYMPDQFITSTLNMM